VYVGPRFLGNLSFRGFLVSCGIKWRFLWMGHRKLRTRTSMFAKVLQIFWGRTSCKKSADLQGNLLQKNNFSAAYKTSFQYTK
jgi:hypothetical protein